MGGQEHFYMEPMACVAAPGAEGTLEVTVASHGTYFTQVGSLFVTFFIFHFLFNLSKSTLSKKYLSKSKSSL